MWYPAALSGDALAPHEKSSGQWYTEEVGIAGTKWYKFAQLIGRKLLSREAAKHIEPSELWLCPGEVSLGQV